MNPTGPIGDRRGMTQNSVLAIVLAAGKGTRMKSDTPKVMHGLAGAPLLVHVLAAAKAASVEEICLVVGPGMDDVASVARKVDPGLPVFVQPEQRGTADAVKAAQDALRRFRRSGDHSLRGHAAVAPGDDRPASCRRSPRAPISW